MKKVAATLAIISLLALATLLGIYRSLFGDLPAPQAMGQRLAMPSVRITDRNGRSLYDIIDTQGGRHTALPLDLIPLAMKQATIATEDRNFYQNPGVDAKGIVRAFWVNLRGGEVVAGGSTITQQVARNLLLDEDERSQRTVRRKLRESWLAWRAARELDKDEILSLYLNQMYYGALAYGVEAAAQTYFGKSAADLTLAESALLAGLTQAPSVYNPFVNLEAAKERQGIVLELMRQAGYISETERALAAREPLFLATAPFPINAPHFVLMVQAELDRLFSQEEIYRHGGLTVRTTLDLDWQQHAERAIDEQLRRLNHPLDGGPGHNAHNAALVALNPRSGEILALVGNVDFFDEAVSGAINMAIAPRQPGSALKPIIYAAALSPARSTPWTAASMIPDVRTVFMTDDGEPYVPANFSRQEHGPVLLRQALGSSLNIPAVMVLDDLGVETAIDVAKDLGITGLGDPDELDLSLALGGGPVRLLDLATAYGAFANGGSRLTQRLILDVTDAAGDVQYSAPSPRLVRVLDERVAWLISDILSDNQARLLSFGSNSILKLDRPAAVKTGTTNEHRDNWTVGYTPDLVVGVWVGNANNQPMLDVTGVSGAGPIWHHFMRTVLAGEPETAFQRPPGLVQLEICALSGLLPGEDCPYRRREWFLAGTQPTTTDTFYQRVTMDMRTRQLASELTRPEQRVEQLVLDLPPLLHPWARANGLVLLDDLLLASENGGLLLEGTTGSAGSGTTALRLISPDPQAIYRISDALPPEAQQLRLEAIGDERFIEISLWIDGKEIATLSDPPFESWWPLVPGHHRAWAEGRSAGGVHMISAPVSFEVGEAAEE